MNVQDTYRIRHRGIESTPHSISELRHLWKAGQIDSSTEFRRGDSKVWLDASNLLPELERNTNSPDPGAPPPVHPKVYPALGDGLPVMPQSVRVNSLKIPFGEVFVLVLKFYLAALVIAALATAAWVLLARFLR
jgi:hypothetical protein